MATVPKKTSAAVEEILRALTCPNVIVNGTRRWLRNTDRESIAEWAGIEGIRWNGGDMRMSPDQAFAFRMRFE